MTTLTSAGLAAALRHRNGGVVAAAGCGTNSLLLTQWDSATITFSAAASVITASSGAAAALRRAGTVADVAGLGTDTVSLELDSGTRITLSNVGNSILASTSNPELIFPGTGGSSTATFTTSFAGGNSTNLRWTARQAGPDGNRYNVTYVTTPGDPESGTGATVSISGYDITVKLDCAYTDTPSLITNLTGANNDIEFDALTGGTAVNSWRIRYVDPGAADQSLTLSKSGNDYTVSLQTDLSSAITTTASDIITAVNANSDFNVHMQAQNAAANNGSGLVTAMAYTNFSGGTDTITVASTANEVASAAGANVDVAAAVVANPITTGTGIQEALTKSYLSGGD